MAEQIEEVVKINKGIERSDFAQRVNYKNGLPDIPSDVKFLPYSFDAKKYCKYETTSLERDYAYEIYGQDDAGVDVNLMDLDMYIPEPGKKLNKTDEILLEDEASSDFKNVKRVKNVSWLRKSGHFNVNLKPQKSTSILETTIGGGLHPENLKETRMHTKEEQLKTILASFEDCKNEITLHPSKKDVHPVGIYPIFPDEELWKYNFSYITFDALPTVQGKRTQILEDEYKDAILKGMSDEFGEYVGYFIKNVHMNSLSSSDIIYDMVREYNWIIQNVSSGGTEDLYFLRMLPDSVVYGEISAKVRLNKRRLPGGQLKNDDCFTVLSITPTEPSSFEIAEQNKKIESLSAKTKLIKSDNSAASLKKTLLSKSMEFHDKNIQQDDINDAEKSSDL